MPDKSTLQSQLEDAEVLEELMDSGAVSEAINEIPGIESTESAFGHVSAIESLERGQTSARRSLCRGSHCDGGMAIRRCW